MKIPVGRNQETNNFVFIEELDISSRGLKCNCVCPACGGVLVARFCKDKINHFSHYGSSGKESCGETALHLMGKKVLSSMSSIRIPSYPIYSSSKIDKIGRYVAPETLILFGNTPLKFNLSEKEKAIGDIRGDILIQTEYVSKNLPVNFEIKVWSKVSEEKRRKISDLQITTVEIDLSGLLKASEINFDIVRNAIEDTNNHTIHHVDSSFLKDFYTNLNTQQDCKVININQLIDSTLNSFKETLSIEGVFLPGIAFQLLPIPDKYMRDKITPLLPEAPKVSGQFQFIGVQHIENEEFLLKIGTGVGTQIGRASCRERVYAPV